MKLEKYEITDEGFRITLSKSELERLSEHYCNVVNRMPRMNFKRHYYAGIVDAIGSILKCFEEEDA